MCSSAHRLKLKDTQANTQLSTHKHSHANTVRYSALHIEIKTTDACTHAAGCSVFIRLAAEGSEGTQQLRQISDKLNSSQSSFALLMGKNVEAGRWLTSKTQLSHPRLPRYTSPLIRAELTYSNLPVWLTRHINRSTTTTWYFKTFLRSMLGYLMNSHCDFRGQNIPNKILRNCVSLTVPLDIFKPNIQKTTNLVQSLKKDVFRYLKTTKSSCCFQNAAYRQHLEGFLLQSRIDFSQAVSSLFQKEKNIDCW